MAALSRGMKIGLGIALAGLLILAVVLFFVGRGTADTSGDPAATAQVIVEKTLTAQPPTATPGTIVITTTPLPAAPATDVPSVPATAVPATSAMSGWTEVEHDFAGGLRRVYNHDMDGRTSDVFLTWYFVEVLDGGGQVTENLGQCSLRVTLDPEGEKVATQGGWRRFRWESGTPGKTDIEALVTWWVNSLESEPGGACSNSGAYTVSWQNIVNAPSAQQAGGEPVGWTEIPEMFNPAGDILVSDVVNHGISNMTTIAWFWAGPGPSAPSNGCTMYVISNSGQSNLVYQGARRTWTFNSSYTAEDVKALVHWWISVLESEPRGGCAHSGAYAVSWQNSALAPADPRGRP